jgi:protein-S-isoprenylcysteine O-methyltransferase Ste14
MNPTYASALRSSVLSTLALAALLFVPAGTLRYWQGWAFAFVFIAACAAFTVYLARYDPALLRRRMRAGASQEQEPVQKIVIRLVMLGFILLIAVPALDYRFGWSRAPWTVAVAGDLLVAFAFFCFYRVLRINSFAASTVRVEDGQHVVSTGPYAWVRHPMYAAAFALLIGVPLALGSWWGLLVVPFFVPVFVVRLLNEEDVLARELSGYTAYQQQVRYRLIPFVW